MQTGLGRAVLTTVILAALVLASDTLSERSFAGKDKAAPHKLTILFTGDDWGNVKPACT